MAVELYDEHEQSERVRKWVREYGFSIVMGVVLAFAGIFGWRQWGEYQTGQAQLASEYYSIVRTELEAGRVDSAEAQYQAMRDAVGRRAYTALAGMLMANLLVEEGRVEEVVPIYSEILERRKFRALWPVAKLRLARVYHALGDASAALALLEGSPPDGFEAAWAEVRGDLLLADGRVEEARQAYRQAVEKITGDGGNPRLVQIKLDATGPGGQS